MVGGGSSGRMPKGEFAEIKLIQALDRRIPAHLVNTHLEVHDGWTVPRSTCNKSLDLISLLEGKNEHFRGSSVGKKEEYGGKHPETECFFFSTSTS